MDRYIILKNEAVFINVRLKMYFDFYRNESHRKLLLAGAPLFGMIGDVVFLEAILLSICRITDPRSTRVRKEDRNNCVLAQLLTQVGDRGVKNRLSGILSELKVLTKKIRVLRNTSIAHADEINYLNSVTLKDGRIERSASPYKLDDLRINECVLKINEFLNGFERAKKYDEVLYEQSSWKSDEGEDYIFNVLRFGMAALKAVSEGTVELNMLESIIDKEGL